MSIPGLFWLTLTYFILFSRFTSKEPSSSFKVKTAAEDDDLDEILDGMSPVGSSSLPLSKQRRPTPPPSHDFFFRNNTPQPNCPSFLNLEPHALLLDFSKKSEERDEFDDLLGSLTLSPNASPVGPGPVRIDFWGSSIDTVCMMERLYMYMTCFIHDSNLRMKK